MTDNNENRLEADPFISVEYMKATITSDIFTILEEESISKNRFGRSRQCVSRIFNGTTNFPLRLKLFLMYLAGVLIWKL